MTSAKMRSGRVADRACESYARKFALRSASPLAIMRAARFAALPAVALTGFVMPEADLQAAALQRAFEVHVIGKSGLFGTPGPGPIVTVKLVPDDELTRASPNVAVSATGSGGRNPSPGSGEPLRIGGPEVSDPMFYSLHGSATAKLGVLAGSVLNDCGRVMSGARDLWHGQEPFAPAPGVFKPIAVDIASVLAWDGPTSAATVHGHVQVPEWLATAVERPSDMPDKPVATQPTAVEVRGSNTLVFRKANPAPEPTGAAWLSAVVTDQLETTARRLGALSDRIRDGQRLVVLGERDAPSAGQRHVDVRAARRGTPSAGTEALQYRYGAESQFLSAGSSLAAALQGGASAGGSNSGGTRTSLVASGSAGFDTNPFLSDRQNPEAASIRLQLAPVISREDARNTLRASGRIEHIEYLGRYASLQNFGADLAAVHRANERLQFNAAALFRSDILATDLTNPLNNVQTPDPVVPVIPGGNDVTVLGQRQRRTQYGADGGLAFTLSPRDELRWSLAFRADRFGGNDLTNSNFYSQQLSYSRQVSEGMRIGALVDASIIDFPTSDFGDARTVTPQALVTVQLDERLRATGTAGVAITRIELPGGRETNTAFAGNLSLCYGATRSSLCLTGARQVLPSAIGGARVQTTGGASYSLRLTERDTLQLGGNYSTASEPLALAGDNFESINAFARYERRLNERMRLFANGGYIDTSVGNALEASNFQAVVGISVIFGRNQ